MSDVPGLPMGKDIPGVTKQVLIGKDDGAANFAMRRFVIDPGAQTPYHKHDWEHEVFVVEGKGVLVCAEGEKRLERGNVVFVPGGEMHRFRNAGTEIFSMLCMVPMKGA